MKVLRWLNKYFEEAALVIMLCMMVVIMGIQITSRYIFDSSLSWSEEITRFIFIWSGFLSAAYCIKNGASVKVEQLVNMFPEKATNFMRLISYAVEIIFFAYLIPFSYSYIMSAVESNQVSPAVGIPMYYIQSATLFSFSLCILRLVQKWIYRFKLVFGKTAEGVVK